MDEPAPATAPDAAAPQSYRGRRIARYLATRLVGAVVGLLALLAIAVYVLDTGPGRRFVADQLQSLELQNGLRFKVGRIEGSIYHGMILHDFSVLDTKGEFLFSPEVHLDWRPFDYLYNHVDIRSATARRMVMRRLPVLRPTPPSTEPLLPDLDIDIGRLRIDRFIAEAPVTGERREMTISGRAHIADRRAQVWMDGRTLAVAGNKGGDDVRLALDAVPERNRLSLDLRMEAPRDGVIAALAGLRQSLSLRASGRGDWQRWEGVFDAELGGTELARLAVAARNGRFTLKGPVRLARLAADTPARLLGEVTTLDLTADWANRRATLSGTAFSDTLRVDTSGVVDLSRNAFDGLSLKIGMLRPGAIAPNLSARNLRADLTLDGAFAKPKVGYALQAERLAMNDMALERLSASGEARVDPDRIVIPVAATVARITGLDTVAGGALANVRLSGDIAISGPRILSDNMRIRSDRIDAKAILLADVSKGLYTGAIDGRIDNYRIESVGVFNIESDARLESLASGGFALAGRIRARSIRLFNSGVRDFLGGNAAGSADVRYGPDGVVHIANLRVQAPLLRITGGEGTYSPGGQIALSARAVSQPYGAGSVRLTGTLDKPQAKVIAQRPDFGIGLSNVEALITGIGNGYRFDLTGDTDYGPLRADVTLGLQGSDMAIRIDRANLSGIDFSGSLRRTSAGPFTGELLANGNGLGGVVRLGAEGRYQAAVVNMRSTGTVLPGAAGLSVGSAIVDARVVLYKEPHVVADVQVAGTTFRGVTYHAARAIIDYRNGRGHAKALVEGTSGVPFRIAANADLAPDLWRASLSGKARGIAFRTASPARIVPGRNGYELLPTMLAVGSGNVRLAGKLGDTLMLQSRFEDMDLAIVNTLLPGYGLGGRANGSLDFEQRGSAFPQADARLSVSDFTRTTAASVSQPVDINFVGKLLPDGGEARAVFRRRGSVIGRMIASLRPLSPGAGSWTTRLLGAPLGGGIRYNGPAETLFSFAGQADQRVTGPIGVAADFSCRVSDPCLTGIVRGRGLGYENQHYGTKLAQMELAARFAGNRLEVETLTAKAGAGTLSGKGHISLASAEGYPMDMAFTLDNARVARGDLLSARATGNLRLTKAPGEIALLSGELRLPETRYKIVRQGAAEVPTLESVRFSPPRGPVRVTGNEAAPRTPSLFDRVRLDIELSAPERLYVSGMGLESEWRANFKVGGTSAEPQIAGNVDLLRGTLGFAGRSFELQEGHIGFPGGRVVNPTVNVTASEEVEDITVNVNVTGRALNPRITFSSVPGLPQDEILSRVLFGDSIANLSTLQAVQLAASFNSLRATGGGLNPLGKLRSATGVDRLRILSPDDATGRGTAIAAGQYITNDIYVELITDARGFTATQLEVSITPWLSLLSQAGGSGITDLNLRVKKNY